MDFLSCNSEKLRQVLTNPNSDPELYSAIMNIIKFLKERKAFYAAVIGSRVYELSINMDGLYYFKEYEQRSWNIGTNKLSGLVIDLIDGCIFTLPCNWNFEGRLIKGSIEGVLRYDKYSSTYKFDYFEISHFGEYSEPVVCSPDFKSFRRRKAKKSTETAQGKPTVITI